MFIHKLNIGDVELENNLILAPMAGVNDLPFRIICKKYGNPGLVCNEMVSADWFVMRWLAQKQYVITMKKQKLC